MNGLEKKQEWKDPLKRLHPEDFDGFYRDVDGNRVDEDKISWSDDQSPYYCDKFTWVFPNVKHLNKVAPEDRDLFFRWLEFKQTDDLVKAIVRKSFAYPHHKTYLGTSIFFTGCLFILYDFYTNHNEMFMRIIQGAVGK